MKKPFFLSAEVGTQLWCSLHLFSFSLHSKVQHFNRRPFPIISFFSQSSAHDCESWNRVLFKSFINLTLSYLSRKGLSGMLPYVRWNFDGQGSPDNAESVFWKKQTFVVCNAIDCRGKPLDSPCFLRYPMDRKYFWWFYFTLFCYFLNPGKVGLNFCVNINAFRTAFSI